MQHTWHISKKKETYGFNSQKNPDEPQPLLQPFIDALYDAIQNIKFKNRTNEFQKQYKENVTKKIDACNKLLVKGDKSNNFHEIPPEQLDNIMKREIQKQYKKSSHQEFENVTKEDKRIATKMDIANRVFKTAPVEAFVTIKDHKDNYQNSLPARLSMEQSKI